MTWPWQYSARIAELQRAATESERARLALELGNAHLQTENTFLRDQMVKALENERFALRFQANCASQKEYGVKTYADTPGMPEFDETKALQPGPARSQGIDLVNRAKQDFLAEARQRAANGEYLPMPVEDLEALVANF
ncbi:MAG: hypothetical protein M3O20_13740 [Acidobacteriota bacterium]|nr:hypothetical protein [Acidobacteriota bacterium]